MVWFYKIGKLLERGSSIEQYHFWPVDTVGESGASQASQQQKGAEMVIIGPAILLS